jgi:hypothetical protein
MAQMIPFKYAGFWDIPRYILLRYRGEFLYLASEFDDDLDDYSNHYTVYVLPGYVEVSAVEGQWNAILQSTMRKVGRIPVVAVVFDATKRKELDASCLDNLLAGHPGIATS